MKRLRSHPKGDFMFLVLERHPQTIILQGCVGNIADAVVFLPGDAAAYITRQYMAKSGGWSLTQ
jgi:hypothetical protein